VSPGGALIQPSPPTVQMKSQLQRVTQARLKLVGSVSQHLVPPTAFSSPQVCAARKGHLIPWDLIASDSLRFGLVLFHLCWKRSYCVRNDLRLYLQTIIALKW